MRRFLGGRPLGLDGIVGNFFKEEEIDLLVFVTLDTSAFHYLPNNFSQAASLVLKPKQALFHSNSTESLIKRARRGIFDLIKDNYWNWRNPLVGFYHTGSEDDIRKRWEEGKSELTKEWKKKW